MSVTKISPIRLNELLKKLERFGLFCRSGKGSEIVVTSYIFGKEQHPEHFRRYRIGIHGSSKRTSPLISSHTVEALLRRFKITRDDFLVVLH